MAILDGRVDLDKQEADPSGWHGRLVIGAQGFFIL
jgi:hypothetical protein